ncbi:adenosine deaminase [Ktedonosporobacter rubrisoli]|uniref:Adenosine deaminase n=1 Tax=Ktedonosporobacter rubrisoli TaxID=2509675 RepID=A0A4P6JIF8_KTERU|nr:adenosine deaminase [Ktedonosporobacter rubrisoli]QBD74692.1 adenosine deaminase [Ktedonosporobacter rubrisoli]
MERAQAIERYLQAVPKAELHVHLEGSILPATLLKLAQHNGISLPVSTVEEARRWFQYRDFAHFIEIYFLISGCLKTEEDYELITYEFGAEMARQNVRYAEVTFSPSTHFFNMGIKHDVYFTGLNKGRERARTEFGVEMRWVFDIVRNASSQQELHRKADYTTSVAIESMQEGVIALGLGGAEVGSPPEQFAPWFEKALAAGLHSTPHAGETVGPESVWGALRTLGAERIGHGVRSIEDPSLVKHLAQEGIPLELCPLSNICLGVYKHIAEHPLPRLYAAGVPLSVNSDDPPLFNVTLNDNVQALYEPFHFDLDTIDEILLNGVRHSFLPQERKAQMEMAFRTEMQKLRQELVGS